MSLQNAKKTDFDIIIKGKFTNQRKSTSKFFKKQQIIQYIIGLFVQLHEIERFM